MIFSKMAVLRRTATAAEETAGTMRFESIPSTSLAVVNVELWDGSIQTSPFTSNAYVDSNGDIIVENVGGQQGFAQDMTVVVFVAYNV